MLHSCRSSAHSRAFIIYFKIHMNPEENTTPEATEETPAAPAAEEAPAEAPATEEAPAAEESTEGEA